MPDAKEILACWRRSINNPTTEPAIEIHSADVAVVEGYIADLEAQLAASAAKVHLVCDDDSTCTRAAFSSATAAQAHARELGPCAYVRVFDLLPTVPTKTTYFEARVDKSGKPESSRAVERWSYENGMLPGAHVTLSGGVLGVSTLSPEDALQKAKRGHAEHYRPRPLSEWMHNTTKAKD